MGRTDTAVVLGVVILGARRDDDEIAPDRTIEARRRVRRVDKRPPFANTAGHVRSGSFALILARLATFARSVCRRKGESGSAKFAIGRFNVGSVLSRGTDLAHVVD